MHISHFPDPQLLYLVSIYSKKRRTVSGDNQFMQWFVEQNASHDSSDHTAMSRPYNIQGQKFLTALQSSVFHDS